MQAYETLPVVNSSTPTSTITNPVVAVASASPQTSGSSSAADTVSASGASTSLDTSRQGFISVDPINAPTLNAGTTFALTVPQTAFRHVRNDAQISLSANLPDGTALPNWAVFDTTRNVLSGSAPEGISQLDVEVTAVDEQGNKISAIINLKFSKN
jgi:hypothetical protein